FDRIAFLSHRGYLLARTVLRRVGHGVAAISISLHLKDSRSFAGSAPCDGLFARGMHGFYIHAVDLFAWNVERGAALEKLGFGAGTLNAGAHRVLIVLNHIDDRQLPKFGHVEGFVHLPLIGGAVAEIRYADVLVAPILVRESEPGSERNLGADDAVTTEKFLLGAEHVHRATLAFGIARSPSGEFRHHHLRIHATGEHVAVFAIGGDDLIVGAPCRGHSNDNRLLTD